MREPGGTKQAAGGSDSCLASTPTSEKFVSLFLQFRSIRQRSAHERTAGIIPPLTPTEFYSTMSRERTEAGNGRESGRKEIGRASCRERVCQYVYFSVVAVPLKQ